MVLGRNKEQVKPASAQDSPAPTQNRMWDIMDINHVINCTQNPKGYRRIPGPAQGFRKGPLDQPLQRKVLELRHRRM